MKKKKDDSFRDFVMDDLFSGMPGIISRSMFGGFGIYKGGAIFAIIADGVLYFKANDKNRADYESYGSRPFIYTMPNKKTMEMSYFELPEEIMENKEELKMWIQKSVSASRETRKKK